jgi:hypothetical protein
LTCQQKHSMNRSDQLASSPISGRTTVNPQYRHHQCISVSPSTLVATHDGFRSNAMDCILRSAQVVQPVTAGTSQIVTVTQSNTTSEPLAYHIFGIFAGFEFLSPSKGSPLSRTLSFLFSLFAVKLHFLYSLLQGVLPSSYYRTTLGASKYCQNQQCEFSNHLILEAGANTYLHGPDGV